MCCSLILRRGSLCSILFKRHLDIQNPGKVDVYMLTLLYLNTSRTVFSAEILYFSLNY